jgi:hypothetical protein
MDLNQQMLNLHKHMIRFISINSIIFILLISSDFMFWISSGWLNGLSLSKINSMIFLSIPASICLVGIYNFKNRTKTGYTLALTLLTSIGGFFAIIGILLLFGDIIHMVQGGLLILLAFTTLKRMKTIKSQTFKSWYYLDSLQLNPGTLNEDEVLASCPTCSSLLAVIPSKLTPDDNCPNCGHNLVENSIDTNEEE